jgi:OPA family glycerol-3-phosphate transporter-like MFS transporter
MTASVGLPSARARVGATLWATVTNSPIWILALGLFGLDIVRYGFLDWAPSQLQEANQSDPMVASLKIAVLPLAGALGALVSGYLSDRFFASRRAPVIALMLVATGALTLAYPRLVIAGTATTVACLGAIGFFLYGAQILLVGTAAQDFARAGATAAAAGFVDFTGSMGAFGGDVVTGWCRQHYGWEGAITFWAASAIVAAAVVATLWRARPSAR